MKLFNAILKWSPLWIIPLWFGFYFTSPGQGQPSLYQTMVQSGTKSGALELGFIVGLVGLPLFALAVSQLTLWFGRQLDISFHRESPEDFKAAIRKLQNEARSKYGRELTYDELEQWNHDRQINARLNAGMVGGLWLLHHFHGSDH